MVMALRRRTVALVAILLLSGCAGLSPLDSESPTAATPPTTSTGSPPTVASTTPLDGEHYVYEDLTGERKAFVDRILDDGSVRTARPPDPFAPNERQYVTYRDTRYVLAWEQRGLVAEYSLDLADPSSDAAIGANDSVVAYRNLSEDARRVFRAARNGTRDAYRADAFPDDLRESDYVAFRGSYYGIGVVVADLIEWDVSLHEVDG